MKRAYAVIEGKGCNFELTAKEVAFSLESEVKILSSKRCKDIKMTFKEADGMNGKKLPIFTVKHEGDPLDLSDFSPVIVSCSEDVKINGETLKRGSEQILLNNDNLIHEKGEFKFRDQRMDRGFRLPPSIKRDFYPSSQEITKNSRVVRIVHKVKSPSEKVILKYVKKLVGEQGLVREAVIMKQLKHPHIINLIDTWDFKNETFMLIEYMKNHDLLNYLNQLNQHMEESVVKFCCFQIVEGLKYLHSLNIAHHDIKLDNVFVQLVKEKPLCKIGDFGLSAIDFTKDLGGTALYLSPELYKADPVLSPKGPISLIKADMWALGVIIYTLLCGKYPFHSNARELRHEIIRGYIDYEHEDWKSSTEASKSIVRSLLQMNPARRPTSEELAMNEWFSKDSFLKIDIAIMKFHIRLMKMDIAYNWNQPQETGNNLNAVKKLKEVVNDENREKVGGAGKGVLTRAMKRKLVGITPLMSKRQRENF